MADLDPKLDDVLKKFLSEKRIVIADNSTGSCVRMAATLVEMGSKRNMIDVSVNFEEARQLVMEKKPGLVLCEFSLGDHSGLDLLQDLRQREGKKKESIFVLVTGNNSQAAVAQAAEEDVDSFVLKPYNMMSLRKALAITINARLNPSQYITTIEKGKEAMVAGNITEAVKLFDDALVMDPKPTLAYFYLGQARMLLEALDTAKGNFQDGLNLNKIHYKCLVGLYELLYRQGRYEEAYGIVRRIAQYFPANPKRLASVLKLAIVTKNYEDIENYYRLFTLLDERDADLVNYVCAALIVTGRYYLEKRTQTRALELLEKAAISCAGRAKFLRFIIETLTEFSLSKEAATVLTRFTPNTQSGEDYATAKFMVASMTKGNGSAIEQGRQLIQSGVKNPILYKRMVSVLFENGFPDSAEDTARQGQSLWPEMRQDFDYLVSKMKA